MRTGRELLIASRGFASEFRWLSWWHFWSTLALFIFLLAIAASPLSLIVRGLSSFLAGLVCVRMFIIFHDYQHQAILGNSRIAGVILWVYGTLTLSPPSVWNRSHSHHHKHNSKSFGANVGSFPVMTKECYRESTAGERFVYLATRHPLTILFAYITVFLWGMSLRPFFQNPIRHLDGGFAALSHLVLITTLGVTLGTQTALLVVIAPLFVACSMGGYLFYAQHNFPAAKMRTGTRWNHVEAALDSSSFMEMSPILNWFTGNIGFHHVHHMNAKIPFYRLPEAMSALEELQNPGVTSLRLRDIKACLKLKLWDPSRDRFVGLDE
jgi:omega-6 fatty acid desaturase (delta-12 desaturase)